MKTAELTGAALDWAVAECENKLWAEYENALLASQPAPPRPSEFLRDSHFNKEFTPSTNWSQGGPIIERGAIPIRQLGGKYFPSWQAGTQRCFGPTPLIAAMRCYVASKMGDEIEIPKELL